MANNIQVTAAKRSGTLPTSSRPTSTATPVTVLHHATLECVEGTANKVYHLQVIATTNGYQCVTHHGPIGKRLTEHPETMPHVTYEKAKKAFDQKRGKKLIEYSVVPAEIPQVPRYVGGAKILSDAEREEFLRTHVTKQTINPDAAMRQKRAAAAHQLECDRAMEVITDLLNGGEKFEISEIQTTADPAKSNPLGVITLSKNGGTINVDGSNDATVIQICRRAALEIGGTFQLTGRVEGDRFLVDRDPGNLLKRARPNIVALAGGVSGGIRDTLMRLVEDEKWENLIILSKATRRLHTSIPRAIFREIQHNFDIAPAT